MSWTAIYCYHHFTSLVHHDAFNNTLHTFASNLLFTLFMSMIFPLVPFSQDFVCKNVLQGLPFKCTSCCSPVSAHEDDSPAPLHQLLTHPCFSQTLLTPAAMWLRPLQTVARQHAVKRKPLLSCNSQ